MLYAKCKPSFAGEVIREHFSGTDISASTIDTAPGNTSAHHDVASMVAG